MKKPKALLPSEKIENKIYVIRGHKVMLDSDLAEIYGVETRTLNQAVNRNPHRFPEDFMFRLTKQEYQNLKSQNVISSWGGRRNLPYAFTEHGTVMLASVLNSVVAVEASIHVVRAFVKLREVLTTHKELALKFELLEEKWDKHDDDIQALFEAIKQLMQPENPTRNPIGYKLKT